MEKMEGDPVLEDWQGEVFKLKEVIIEWCVRQEEAGGRQAGGLGLRRKIPQPLRGRCARGVDGARAEELSVSDCLLGRGREC